MSRYANYECLKVGVAEKVATVTLNRPQARNAINQKLIRELRTIWDDLGDDHAVNVVVLTGAGDFFSVGGDVKAMSERPGGDVLEEGEVHDPMISRRAVTRQLELDKPIIAAINGDAIGLAATHALLSDITVMADDARIGDTHVSRVGLVAGDGGTVIWPLLIGINKAKEFLIRGTLLKVGRPSGSDWSIMSYRGRKCWQRPARSRSSSPMARPGPSVGPSCRSTRSSRIASTCCWKRRWRWSR